MKIVAWTNCLSSSIDTVTVAAIVVAKWDVSAFIRDPVQQTLPSIPFHYWGNAGQLSAGQKKEEGSNALGSPGGQPAAGS